MRRRARESLLSLSKKRGDERQLSEKYNLQKTIKGVQKH